MAMITTLKSRSATGTPANQNINKRTTWLSAHSLIFNYGLLDKRTFFTEYAKENSWELHFEPEEKESDLDVSKFYSLLDEVKDYKNLNYNT